MLELMEETTTQKVSQISAQVRTKICVSKQSTATITHRSILSCKSPSIFTLGNKTRIMTNPCRNPRSVTDKPKP